MLRAFDLARLGIGQVSPNPLVGCIVVNDGRIVGEGWHKAFGGPHAEVNAINSLVDSNLLFQSTIYVNLEPCSFHGKTPACTDLLIRSKVSKVVISNHDPNPRVNGEGIRLLTENGIEVRENVLYDKGRELNKRFFVNQEKQRPYVILKWAETSDGFIAREDKSSKWISSDESRKLVHKWRSEEDAILVGRVTAQFDNPRLDVRDWKGSNPIRIVIDPLNKLKGDLNIKDKSVPTLIYNLQKEEILKNLTFIKIKDHGNVVRSVMSDLMDRNVGSVIVEGGSKTLQYFIDHNIWDEARVFKSKTIFRKGIEAPILNTKVNSSSRIASDLLDIYKNN